MEVNANIHLVKKEEGNSLVAFGDLLINNMLMIKNIRVLEVDAVDPHTKEKTGEKTLMVSMPREQGSDGKWYDIAYGSSPGIRQAIRDAVFEAVKKEIQKSAATIEVEVLKVNLVDHKSLKGFANINIEGIIIKGLKIVEGSKGLFVTMPQTKGANKDIVYPIDKFGRDIIQDRVLKMYQLEVDKIITPREEKRCQSTSAQEQENLNPEETEMEHIVMQYNQKYSDLPDIRERFSEDVWMAILDQVRADTTLSDKDKVTKINGFEELKKRYDHLFVEQKLSPDDKKKLKMINKQLSEDINKLSAYKSRHIRSTGSERIMEQSIKTLKTSIEGLTKERDVLQIKGDLKDKNIKYTGSQTKGAR